MKYTVTVSRIVKVRIAYIEADSQTDAIQVANEAPFHNLFPSTDLPNVVLNTQRNPDGSLPQVLWTEDGEDTLEYLVDEEGDEDFVRSRWYASDGVSTPEWAKRQAEATAPPTTSGRAPVSWLRFIYRKLRSCSARSGPLHRDRLA